MSHEASPSHARATKTCSLPNAISPRRRHVLLSRRSVRDSHFVVPSGMTCFLVVLQGVSDSCVLLVARHVQHSTVPYANDCKLHYLLEVVSSRPLSVVADIVHLRKACTPLLGVDAPTRPEVPLHVLPCEYLKNESSRRRHPSNRPLAPSGRAEPSFYTCGR